MNLSTQPYKGTRDYYPEDKRVQNYIFATWRKVVESFGYEEYGAPTLEPIEVYQAKSGDELANTQTYAFEDRGGRTVAIRPEMTPSISRMVAARRQELAYPARLYSIANFMRYERPQRGREREFWQLNVDVFGVDNNQADSEIITIADQILKAFGATGDEYKIRINSRELINVMTRDYLGLDESESGAMIKLLDRKDKITRGDFDAQAAEIVGSKAGEVLPKLDVLLAAGGFDSLPDELKQTKEAQALQEVFVGIAANGVVSAVFDITLMRGLDYYTGTVFEVFDTHPDNNRALFGGGRYDGLVGLFGAEPISAVGFAPGGTMLENFLTVHNLLPENKSATAAYVVVIDESFEAANELAAKLRKEGINVEVDITARKLDKQIKTADKKGIERVIFVGKKEAESGMYTLKNIVTGADQSLSLDQLVQELA